MRRYIKQIITLTFVLTLVLILLNRRANKSYESFNANTWTSDTELVIVSSHWNEDLTWLKSLSIPIVVCGKDGETPSAIPTNIRCKTPNIGYETSSYLKFIIEFYDELPAHVAFIHGHENAYHQTRDLAEILNSNEWKTGKYYTLNFYPINRCIDGDDIARPLLKNIAIVWNEYFKPYLNIPTPSCVETDCCAQFVLPRDIIKRYPKSVYEHWYKLIMSDSQEKFNINTKDMAIVFEHVWYLIFG